MAKALDSSVKLAKVKAQEKARVPAWRNVMEKGINIGNRSNSSASVISNTNQGWLFETGYQGEVDVTPLLQAWGQDKNVRIPKQGKFNVNFRRQPSVYKFMFKSIPNKGETKSLMDSAFSQTMRGGTV